MIGRYKLRPNGQEYQGEKYCKNVPWYLRKTDKLVKVV